MTNIRLSLALAVSEQPSNLTRLVLDEAVRADGIDLIPSDVYSGELIWRQLRFAEFDVAQMSVTALLMLAERGDSPWVAIPVFPFRSFHHTRFQVRADSGIESVDDLQGKRVGVAEYMMTAAVWSRGVLHDEFDADTDSYIWYQERLDSIGAEFGYEPPGDVVINQIPAGQSIASLLSAGDLDGVCIHIAGHTLLDRTGTSVDAMPTMRPLFPDPAAESARYYQKTGVLPINHCIAIRRSVLEDHPWVALNLYKAFMEAKEQLLAPSRRLIDTYFQLGHLPIGARRSLPGDPMPYGIAANRNTLETIARYAEEQGLTKRRVGLEEIFSANAMDT